MYALTGKENKSTVKTLDLTLTESMTYYKQGTHETTLPKTYSYSFTKSTSVSRSGYISLSYDSCENISSITYDGSTTTYTYDSLGRLEKEVNGQLGHTYTFTYDNNGNIMTKKVDNTTITYAYNGDKLTSYNGQSCVYDAIGNPTTYRGKTATWTRGRTLTAYNGNTFSYDATGRRLSKNNIKFYYDSEGNLLKQSNGLEFFYGADGLVAIKYGGLPYLCRKDMLGNILALLDSSGNIVVQYKYDAWGNHTVTDANGNAITDANHIGNLNPFRYRGYYFDRETGFYFLQSRYYDPEVGRFLNMDGVEYSDTKSVNGINLYSYCGNNPVMGVDPIGTWDWSAIGNFFINVGKVIAGTVLAVAGAAMAAANFLPALVSPSSTVACEVGLSVGMYGVAMVGSVVSSDINADMERINWNPFNNNAEAAAQASVFSFYKGVPVVIIDREDDRSGSFGIIFLDKDDRDADTIRHEYGHVPQLMMLGIARFAFCIGIPSSQQWGVGSSWEYYNAPWEASADFFGGVKQSQASEEAVKRSMKYLLCSYFFGPFVHAFYKKIK